MLKAWWRLAVGRQDGSRYAMVLLAWATFVLFPSLSLRAQGGMSVIESTSRPGSMSRLYFDGHKALLRGDLAGAEHDFQEAIRRMANESVALGDDCLAQAYEGLGAVYFQKGQYQNAVDTLEKAVGLDPRLTVGRTFLGRSYYELHQNSKAIGSLEAALRLKPGDPETTLYLGRVQTELGNYQAAVDLLSKLAQTHSTDPHVLQALSLAYMKQTMDRASSEGKFTPRSFEALQIAAVEAQGRADFKSAAEYYRQALSIKPNAPGLHYALGEALMNMRDFVAATQQFQKEVELDPNNSRALWRLGFFTLHADPKKACEYLERSLKLDPKPAGAVLTYGKALAMTGQTERAVAQYLRALQIKPELRSPHYLLAMAYRKQGREADARTEFAMFEALSKQRSEHAQKRMEEIVEELGHDLAPAEQPSQSGQVQSDPRVAATDERP